MDVAGARGVVQAVEEGEAAPLVAAAAPGVVGFSFPTLQRLWRRPAKFRRWAD